MSAQLALVEINLNQIDEAGDLLDDLLPRCEKVLPTDDITTITAMTGRRNIHQMRGEHSQAAEWSNWIYQSRLCTCGDMNEDTLVAGIILSRLNLELGKFEEHDKLISVILEKRLQLLGTAHEATLEAAACLSSSYALQGRYDESEQVNLRFLREVRQLPESEESDELTATHDQEGYNRTLEEIFNARLERKESRLGITHPETLAAASDLGLTYLNNGRYDKASGILTSLHKMQKNFKRDTHPDTIKTAAHLAMLHLLQGHHRTARTLHIHVLENQRRIFKEDHEDLMLTMYGLGVTHFILRERDEAEELFTQVLQWRREHLGDENPLTLDVLSHLGLIMDQKGHLHKAAKLMDECLEGRRKVLGTEDKDTKEAEAALGSINARRSAKKIPFR
ncbi:hypothetical protein B0I35DRAFT_78185 [Stachybotrys elegans]|uniref:MalT-like TPR region domain-containing protein n=1 Tax=Stachybotrys elegans TaxID=80388 RepID=A0A8K0WN44_9HYPO|nr:hypothetical protein B0I35DRAFT_78185 [Stachybotrys elegans]